MSSGRFCKQKKTANIFLNKLENSLKTTTTKYYIVTDSNTRVVFQN